MPYITLSKKHFFNNLDIIADKTKDKDKIALVLKDNAYGHGLVEVATMAQEYGITKAVVRLYEEAKLIEDFFEYILILADTPKEPNDKFSYVINDAKTLPLFPSNTKVELKVDTLMHRNGIAMGELEDTLSIIEEKGLVLEGVLSHHRSADELTSEWFVQNKLFESVKQKVKSLGYDSIKFHSSNSASLFRTESFNEDMARIGIAAYGCLESDATDTSALKPVLSLLASRNSSRVLRAGERVGYGATYTLDDAKVVSNYDFGYADGFMRHLSNNFITPSGAKLVGRISMDNASFLGDAKELLVFNDAKQVAKLAKTIPYEILTSLKAHIKREILG